MEFFELLAVSKWLLQRRRRISYRTLTRELELDDETLENLRYELIVGARIAADDDGRALVWIGGETSPASKAFDESAAAPDRLPPVDHSESVADISAQASSPPATGAEAERRQLTVMFCDLVGSTALSTRLDPEDLREVITAFQNACRESIGRYDGFIARYMGDGMLVYFGYPQAHENDAERAVRAGLDIVESMTGLNAEFAPRHEVELAVRVGVATGPVVVGDIVGEGAAEEAAVIGETPNLAARLQAVAEPNQVLIASATKQLLGSAFEYADLGMHTLKGIAQPVQAWRALRERDVHSRYEVGSSPLVGRQEELGLLLRSWQASKERHGQAVLVQGEAGIGKSRLVDALREAVADQDYIWIAHRCSPYHANSTLYPIIESVKRALGWEPEDDAALKLAKLEAGLAEQSQPLAEIVPLYAELLSLPLPAGGYEPSSLDPRQKREATLDALAGWLLEIAEKTPVLNVFEDLHWADPTTLEFLVIILEQSPTVSMMNVLTYRPEFTPPWAMHSHMIPITLNRLERPEIETLIGHRACGKQVPAEVVDHIVVKSDGVPLYVEELTRTILESEFLREESDRYTLAGELSELSIPATLQDSLMARLDRLPAVREVAQMGAVLGREFAYEMLRAVIGLEEAQLNNGLEHLVADELLYQRGRLPRSRYIFKHALIQDAAYQSLLKRTRQQYHLQVGQLLEERFPETVEAHPELLAHHFTEGGAVKEAIDAWHKAGELARSRAANQEAVTHLENGLTLVNNLPDGQERARCELKLQLSLGGVYLQMKGHWAPEAESTFARARELCAQVDNAPELVPALFGLWRTYAVQMDKTEKARAYADMLLREAGDDSDPVCYVIAHYAAGFTSIITAEYAAAAEHLREGMDRYSPDDRDSAEVYRFGQDPGIACRCYLAIAEWALGYPDGARQRARDGVAFAERLRDPFTLGFALVFSAWVDQFEGERTSLLEKTEDAIHLSEEKGFPFWLSMAKVMEAWLEATGNPSEATIGILRNRIAHNHSFGTNLFMPYFLALAGEAALSANDLDACGSALNEAEEFQRRTGERWWNTEVSRLQGELLLARDGNPAEAENRFQQALTLAREQNARSFELRAATSLARLWQRQDKRSEARALLAPVYEWFSEGHDTADLQSARLLIAELETSSAKSAVD